MRFFYSPKYEVDIGLHVFPTQKYRLVVEALLKANPEAAALLTQPQPASDEDVLRVHTKEYVHKLKTGTLSRTEEAWLELRWSQPLVLASWLCAGGTIAACGEALKSGCAIHIGGGFHHAFADHGEGFCVVNDIAIGIRWAQAHKLMRKALVVDLDVHQGNGTAAIFAADPDVFTFSMHQWNNYPVVKPPSSLDINLDDGCLDREYLDLLDDALGKIEKRFKPDLIIYVAGADPYEHDQLGGLGITLEGFRQRDRMVFDWAKRRGIPVMAVLAGGYAQNPADTVRIHQQMLQQALLLF